MSTIEDLPNASDFGEQFNYDVWTPNTTIQLCNVPWNSDYRDIVEFPNRASLDAYLSTVAGPTVMISRLTLARAGAPIRLNLPFNACYIYNYLRVDNGTNPITAHYTDSLGNPQVVHDAPKTLYYFIMGVNYIAPNTTEIVVQLDVWQTFGYEIAFGNCYIEQGHIGVANTNQFNNNGRDYLTVSEGLEIGEEYNINETYVKLLTADHKPVMPFEDGPDTDFTFPWVVMGIAADVTTDPGDTTKPNLNLWSAGGGAGTLIESMPNGFDVIVFTSMVGYLLFLANFATTPWITQSIQFITMIPPIISDGNATFEDVGVFNNLNTLSPTIPNCAWHVNTPDLAGLNVLPADIELAANFRTDATNQLPLRYRHLKKFLTYPYCIVELTTYNAAPLILKPELIPDENGLEVTVYQHFAPPNPRWAIVPKHYNATGTGGGSDDGEYLDFATYISNFPQFTVMNNGYLEYLASNAASIAYQERSAGWAQQKALTGANNSFANTQQGMQAQSRNTEIDVKARNAQMAAANAGALMNFGMNGLEAIGTGGLSLMSSGSSMASTGGDMAQRSASNAIANNVANQHLQSSLTQEFNVGSNNLDYARFAAKGDYSNVIAGIQAQISNAKMTQPSMVGQNGGEAFFMAMNIGWKIYAKLKQINPGMMAVIGEYWLRYGYQVNRFGTMPGSLQCMSKFTYWKLKETYIISSRCPEIFKQTIRGIFEKGVTVWANPADIGNIDISLNLPLDGISF